MGSKGYIFKVIKNASFDKMKSVIDEVNKRSGKSKVSIFFDMLMCAKKYGAGYYDYEIFAFYNLNAEQRKTFVTRMWSKKFIEYMNDPEYGDWLDKKDIFYEKYKEYIGREFINVKSASKEEVKKYISTREQIFGKVKDGECGHGCERLNIKDYPDFDKLYDYIVTHFDTIEDVIVNHPAIAKLYPNAVNSMRIITILDKQQVPHCIYIVQKMGLNGSIIDNNCLFTPVDMNTGKIKFPAHSGDTTKGIIYEEHPNTHIKLQGYQIPYVKEAVEMCLKAAKVVPQVRYVGWDVAITPNGPAIIEGNNYCAHDFWQLPPHTPDKTGMIPTIKKYIPEYFE